MGQTDTSGFHNCHSPKVTDCGPVNRGLGGHPSLFRQAWEWGCPSKPGSPANMTPLPGVTRTGACGGRTAARASSVYAPPLQTGRQLLGVGGSEGAAGSGRGGGEGVGGWLAHPSLPGPAAPLSSPRPQPAPTWLNQARLCLADPEHLDPDAPLPRPAPPRLSHGDPAARAFSRGLHECGETPRLTHRATGPRFGKQPSVTTSTVPHFTGGKPRPQDPWEELGFKPTHVSSRAPRA